MRTRHSPGITRLVAGQVLDHTTESYPGHLVLVLNAAAASAREGELAGEQAAMAAFEASLPFEAGTLSYATTPRKRKMPNLPLANLISMKVIAWSLAGLVTVGGAVTAGTVAFSSSGSTSTGANPGDSSPSTVGSTAGSTAGSAVTTMPASGSKGTSGNLSLTAVQQCTDLTTKVESVIGDTGAALNKAGLSSVLASPVVSQVLETAPVSGLLKTVGNATAVPDYCGLVLALPTVPVPSAFTQIPPFILNQALSALPVTDLAGALNSLPTGVLSQTLGDLSSAQLSSVFTMLPPGVAGELLRTLPANSLSSVLTALPVSTVTGLLPNLPTADLTQVLTTLPNAATGTVLSELPTAEQASTQLAAVPAAGGTHLLVHARTAADPWQLLKDAGVVGLPGTVFNTQAPSVRLCSAQPSAVIDAAADRIRAL